MVRERGRERKEGRTNNTHTHTHTHTKERKKEKGNDEKTANKLFSANPFYPPILSIQSRAKDQTQIQMQKNPPGAISIGHAFLLSLQKQRAVR